MVIFASLMSSHMRAIASSVSFCLQDANYAYATRQGIAKRASDVMTQTRLRQTNWNGGWFWRFLEGQKPVFLKHLWNTLRLYSLYFPQNTLMLTESREEFSDLHSIFRLCALSYFNENPGMQTFAKFYEHEHEQASTRLIFASNSSKSRILWALSNWMGLCEKTVYI